MGGVDIFNKVQRPTLWGLLTGLPPALPPMLVGQSTASTADRHSFFVFGLSDSSLGSFGSPLQL